MSGKVGATQLSELAGVENVDLNVGRDEDVGQCAQHADNVLFGMRSGVIDKDAGLSAIGQTEKIKLKACFGDAGVASHVFNQAADGYGALKTLMEDNHKELLIKFDHLSDNHKDLMIKVDHVSDKMDVWSENAEVKFKNGQSNRNNKEYEIDELKADRGGNFGKNPSEAIPVVYFPKSYKDLHTITFAQMDALGDFYGRLFTGQGYIGPPMSARRAEFADFVGAKI